MREKKRWMIVAAALVAVGLAGCVTAAVESAKVGMLAFENDYDAAKPLDPKVMAKYKGYKLGAISAESDERSQEAGQKLPERFVVFMEDDTHLVPGASPAVLISVKNIKVTKREGVVGVALPKIDVIAEVTLTDADKGTLLGTATVSGKTGSRTVGNPMQMASIIARATAKWIADNVKGKDRE